MLINEKHTFRGLAFITSESCLLKPIAVAGNPSVTKFTHRSCTWNALTEKCKKAGSIM